MTKDAPSNTLLKLARGLFSDPVDAEQFTQNVMAGASSRPALIWRKEKPAHLPFPCGSIIPGVDWLTSVDVEARAGAHELHEQGFYYCLDTSSAVSASVMLPAVGELTEPTILDLCSSPGGKAIFAAQAFNTQALTCNEVVKKRLGQLSSNLKRCGLQNAQITSRDPSFFVREGLKYDLVIVDAPCSGQSLVARGMESPGCFHPATINLNSNRQKRIIANAAQVVVPGGFVAYITCTYSEAENEKVVKWLLKKFPMLEPVEVPHLEKHRSNMADFPCYRVWPGGESGAGGFAVLLKKGTGTE